MYHSYIEYLANTQYDNFKDTTFKSNHVYGGILEHVSRELGFKYLDLIHTEFTNITYENIQEYININDKYGKPNIEVYIYNDRKYTCSPTTLRYIYHSLVILDHFKKTNCKNIVEVGCGYGGLCLAINYFSKLLDISINKYNIIDLPEVCKLIKNYLNLHTNSMTIPVCLHDSNTHGNNVHDTELFFISNYCYTEIDIDNNSLYSSILLPKTSNGFIVWQNGGNRGSYPIEKSNLIIKKDIQQIIDEKPQTDAGYGIYKNYFVFF